MTRRIITRRIFIATALVLVGVAPLAAQGSGALPPAFETPELRDGSDWGEDLGLLGINSVLGALTAGILREYRGGSFWDGVWPGAVGGGVGYVGKRIVAERFTAAGLIGRQVSALGSSVIRNASEGRGSFERLALPFGPVRLYVNTVEGPRVSAKVDLAATIMAGWGVLEDGADFQLGESLSSGTPVFRVGDSVDGDWAGAHVAGVVLLRDYGAGEAESLRILPHERVHVLQYDQIFLSWSAPVEASILTHIPGGESFGRYVDLGLNAPVFGILNMLVPYEARPWEQEAYYLTRVRSEGGG
ncbi:MAG TPA: hypothetical protein VFI91_08050 [Longimicrobiaceae bacterium]|nr:hypothetical protein [Longimicrobiaceae bacterium]